MAGAPRRFPWRPEFGSIVSRQSLALASAALAEFPGPFDDLMEGWALHTFTRRHWAFLCAEPNQKRLSSPRKRGSRQVAATRLSPIERAVKMTLFGIPTRSVRRWIPAYAGM